MRIAYIGMGANLPSPAGPPEATLRAAGERIAALGRIAAKSSLYSTAPVGYADQPRFVNAVVALETDLDAQQLLDSLMKIEKEYGRDRADAVPNGPRTLDLDLLLFGDRVIDEPGLHLPHPRMAERAFVLAPLNEIAADRIDPRSGGTVSELLQRLIDIHQCGVEAVVRIDSQAWQAKPFAAGK